MEDEKNIAELEENENEIAERGNKESGLAESGNDANNVEEQAERNRMSLYAISARSPGLISK